MDRNFTICVIYKHCVWLVNIIKDNELLWGTLWIDGKGNRDFRRDSCAEEPNEIPKH
jgi:hypothetical protein